MQSQDTPEIEQIMVEPAPEEEPTDAERRRVTDLALRLRHQEAEVARATAALKGALVAYRRTADVDLPEALQEIGQREFKLLDGTPVELKTALEASQLSDSTNPEGLDWVIANGGAPLVRCQITAAFDAEDLAAAQEVYELIRQHPSGNRLKEIKLERMVPWNTLTSWVGELIQNLVNPPLELLRVRRRIWAQVGEKRPKSIKLTGFEKR